MKYETPELTTLRIAINVIQATKQHPVDMFDSPELTEVGTSAYVEWE
jgi:hypothetical protein